CPSWIESRALSAAATFCPEPGRRRALGPAHCVHQIVGRMGRGQSYGAGSLLRARIPRGAARRAPARRGGMSHPDTSPLDGHRRLKPRKPLRVLLVVHELFPGAPSVPLAAFERIKSEITLHTLALRRDFLEERYRRLGRKLPRRLSLRGIISP